MNCSACGSELPEQAKFCSECGTPNIVAAAPPTADVETPAPPAPPAWVADAPPVVAETVDSVTAGVEHAATGATDAVSSVVDDLAAGVPDGAVPDLSVPGDLVPDVQVPDVSVPSELGSAFDAATIDPPVIDAPAIDTPVIDAPVIDAPVVETSVGDSAPAIPAEWQSAPDLGWQPPQSEVLSEPGADVDTNETVVVTPDVEEPLAPFTVATDSPSDIPAPDASWAVPAPPAADPSAGWAPSPTIDTPAPAEWSAPAVPVAPAPVAPEPATWQTPAVDMPAAPEWQPAPQVEQAPSWQAPPAAPATNWDAPAAPSWEPPAPAAPTWDQSQNTGWAPPAPQQPAAWGQQPGGYPQAPPTQAIPQVGGYPTPGSPEPAAAKKGSGGAPFGGLLLFLGGLMLIGGSFLDWAEALVGNTVITLTGFENATGDLWGGPATIALGVVLVLASFVYFAGASSKRVPAALKALAIVAALAALGFVAYLLLGLVVQDTKANAQIGLWLCLGGSILAVVGSLFGRTKKA